MGPPPSGVPTSGQGRAERRLALWFTAWRFSPARSGVTEILRSDPYGSGEAEISCRGLGGTETPFVRVRLSQRCLLASGETGIVGRPSTHCLSFEPRSPRDVRYIGSVVYDPDSSPRAPGSTESAEPGGQSAFVGILPRRGRASAPAGCSPRVGEGVVDSLFGLDRFHLVGGAAAPSSGLFLRCQPRVPARCWDLIEELIRFSCSTPAPPSAGGGWVG